MGSSFAYSEHIIGGCVITSSFPLYGYALILILYTDQNVGHQKHTINKKTHIDRGFNLYNNHPGVVSAIAVYKNGCKMDCFVSRKAPPPCWKTNVR